MANGNLIVDSIDFISGSTADDASLNGTDGDERISGLDGNDVLYGGAGSDALYGGSGDDILLAHDGYVYDALNPVATADRYDGGAGNDTVSYVSSLQAVNVSLIGEAADEDGDGVFEDKLYSIENVPVRNTFCPRAPKPYKFKGILAIFEI